MINKNIHYSEKQLKEAIGRTLLKLSVKDNNESKLIPLEEKIKLIKDYETMFVDHSFNNPLSLYDLKEGLKRTYPLDKTVDYIQRYFGFENWQIKIMDAYNGIQKIGINIPNINNNVEIVKSKMELCGYFLG